MINNKIHNPFQDSPYFEQVKEISMNTFRFGNCIRFLSTQAKLTNTNSILLLGGWFGLLPSKLQHSRHPFDKFIIYEAVTKFAEVCAQINPTAEVYNAVICEKSKYKPYFIVKKGRTDDSSIYSQGSTQEDDIFKEKVGPCIEPDELINYYKNDLPNMAYRSNIEYCDCDVIDSMIKLNVFPKFMNFEIIGRNLKERFYNTIYPTLSNHYNIEIPPPLIVYDKSWIHFGFGEKTLAWWSKGDIQYKEITR